MNEMTALERGYRRLLACYPRSFLRENADEVLAVLLAPTSVPRPRLALGPDLRIGDADREAITAALGEHFARGRLTLDEFTARLDVALTATRQSEIAQTTRDLPHL